MLTPPPRTTTFLLPVALLPRLHALTGEGGYSTAETLRDLVALAAIEPHRHVRYGRTTGPGPGPVRRVQFVDKPASRVLPLLRARGLRLTSVVTDLLSDPATGDRLTFWRHLTPAERREDFRRAASAAQLAEPVLVQLAARHGGDLLAAP